MAMKLKSVHINVLPKKKEAFLDKCAEVFQLIGTVTELRNKMSEKGYIGLIADLCFGLQSHLFPTGDFTVFPMCAGEKSIKPHVWKKEIWERFAPHVSDGSEIIIQNGITEIHWSFRNGRLIDETAEPEILAWDHTGKLVDPANILPDYFYVENREELEELSRLIENVYDAGVSVPYNIYNMTDPELFVLLDDTFWPVSELEHVCTKVKALLENHLNAKEN